MVERVLVVTGKPDRLPPQVRVWVDARRLHQLSHAQVAMARELGLNPREFGQLSNRRQEPWKTPLPGLERALDALPDDRVASGDRWHDGGDTQQDHQWVSLET